MNEPENKNYPDSKVYYDGSHYIAIPQGSYPSGKGIKKQHIATLTPEQNERKHAFENAYAESKKLPYEQRAEFVDDRLKDTIPDDTERTAFIAENKERKQRNRSKKYTLLWRKVRLQRWNWFVTLTYDSSKCNEKEFKAKLTDTLKKMVQRHKWKYIGVWERGGENGRLHFHGIFVIPDGEMVGEIVSVSDYSTKRKRVQKKLQNTYFLKRFGLNEFVEINEHDVEHSVQYIIKYIEKEGGRLCQGGDIKPYLVANILGEDVLTAYGAEDKKLLLFDDFTCIDQDGVVHGPVSPEVIDRMPKSN